MAFKELYSFTIEEEKEVEKTSKRKNKKTGEETTVTKKVKKKVPIQISIKRPSRRELEEAELVTFTLFAQIGNFLGRLFAFAVAFELFQNFLCAVYHASRHTGHLRYMYTKAVLAAAFYQLA